MTAEDFARVAARITRVVAIDSAAGHANTAGVMAIAAANAFNAGSGDSRRVLLLARGQLTVFGAVREEVASELRRLAQQRDEACRALVAAHYPLLS
jgi:hypothetical protein